MGITFRHLGRTCGVLKSNGDYVIHRTTEHYFIKFKGYGISTTILERLRRLKWYRVVMVLANAEGEQKVWYATPQNFVKDAKYYDNKGDFQRILPMSFWKEKWFVEQKKLEVGKCVLSTL